MQHRFSPMENFPTELKMQPQYGGTKNETDDFLNEILSVAHASQELINNQSSNYSSHSWGTTSAAANQHYYAPSEQEDGFTFMAGRDNTSNYNNDYNYYNNNASWEDPVNTRSIEIGDLEDDFKEERMVENLRWVGMSSKDLEIKVCYLYLFLYMNTVCISMHGKLRVYIECILILITIISN